MNNSLSKALSIFLIVVGFIGISIGGGASYFTVKDRLNTDYTQDVESTVGLADAALVEAIFAYDFEQAQAVTDALINSEILRSVVVVDQRGKEISSSGISVKNLSNTEHSVVRGDAKIGTITFQFDPAIIGQSMQDEMLLMMFSIVLVLVMVVVSVYFFMRSVVIQPIDDVTNSLHRLSTGDADLSQRISVKSNNEIGRLTKNFNDLMDNLTDMIGSVANISDNISDISNTLTTVARKSQDDAQSQQASMQTAATSLEEVSVTAEDVYRNAEATLAKTQEAINCVEEGGRLVEQNGSLATSLSEQISETSQRIDALIQSSSDIGSVVEVILSIAEQTNLLALNAAIEAARAGDQGRGFAVVADEVRALAQKTQNSTSEIETIVSSLQSNAKRAADSMGASLVSSQEVTAAAITLSANLQKISVDIESINSMNSEVAVATKQQSEVTKTIAINIDDLNQLSSSLSASATGVNAKVEEIQGVNRDLTSNIGRFNM
ncbi:methyl-accepting chemotaxis protein [Vibrio sp. 10N.286.49.F3]|uniref:methyl-accepting chemotaxis protein n=1 Tax=unclassified Vibrio TaxID=2614977 RepID=UPI003554426D